MNRRPDTRPVAGTAMITVVLAVFLACALVLSSCSSKTETPAGTDMGDVETTDQKAELTQKMYESVEIGMSYGEVQKIIGQAPNRAQEVEDEFSQTGTVLRCTWEGAPGTGQYQGESNLIVSFDQGKVSEKEATNLK